MKIVCVGMFALFPKGTVSARALPLAQALAGRGHEVRVVVPPWDNPAESGKRLVVDGVPVVNIRVPRRFPLLGHLIILSRLLRETVRHKPEVVYVFKPKAHAGLVAMSFWLLKRLGRNIRLVVDSDDWEGKGGWNEIARYSPWQRAFFAFQEQWILRHADAVTVASRELSRMVATMRRGSDRVYYVPNCMSAEALARTTRGKEEIRARFGLSDGPVILLYTRFFEFGLERVVAILARVFAAVPEARLLVVGQGLFGEESRFVALCRAAGIENHVASAGWVEPASLGAHLAAADLAIYPLDDTLINRTKCPMKLLELLGAGLPVVAERVGQTTEYVVDGETGILVAAGNGEEFAARVVDLLRRPDLRRQLGDHAKEWVLASYLWQQWAATVEEACLCGA